MHFSGIELVKGERPENEGKCTWGQAGNAQVHQLCTNAVGFGKHGVHKPGGKRSLNLKRKKAYENIVRVC